MSALPVISELSDKGIHLRVDGPDLVISPKSSLTPMLISKLKKEKPALTQILEKIGQDTRSDWEEVADDPGKLKAFYELLVIGEMREKGIAPDHYTATSTCRRCGPVPIFEGLPGKVNGCPWCFNRVKGLPMPRK